MINSFDTWFTHVGLPYNSSNNNSNPLKHLLWCDQSFIFQHKWAYNMWHRWNSDFRFEIYMKNGFWKYMICHVSLMLQLCHSKGCEALFRCVIYMLLHNQLYINHPNQVRSYYSFPVRSASAVASFGRSALSTSKEICSVLPISGPLLLLDWSCT